MTHASTNYKKSIIFHKLNMFTFPLACYNFMQHVETTIKV